MHHKTAIYLSTITAFLTIAILLIPHNNTRNHSETCWLPTKSALRNLAPSPVGSSAAHDIMLMEGQAGHHNQVITPSAPEDQTPQQLPAPDSDYTKAIKLMKAAKLKEASQLLEQYLAVNPAHAEAWRQLGDCRYNLGQVEKALQAYRLSLRKDNRNYLAERGRGIAALYMGYDYFSKGDKRLAHSYFQTALNSLHSCLSANPKDKLAQYGQALAAEGASRKLYNIAQKALGGKNHEQAKEIIRNCLDIIDVAISATNSRISDKPQDGEARMLLGCLLLRRAKVLQPFGHYEEATQNITDALNAFKPLTTNNTRHSQIAQVQADICRELIKKWK